MKKSCIAVLTRGYSNQIYYDKLLRRNLHIETHLTDKTTEILIFHEGNISEDDQVYIMLHTPLLKIKFVNINNGLAFRKEKDYVQLDRTIMCPRGYRHMCSFWFVDFWHFVKDYDKLLRIDEDCFIEFNVDSVFEKLDKYKFVCGEWGNDENFVTKGLNDFTLHHLNKPKSEAKRPAGPYTNVFAINLDSVRNSESLKNYIDSTDKSNKIYSQRWGDLPLWGEAIHYIFGMNEVSIDKLSYFHASHNTQVN